MWYLVAVIPSVWALLESWDVWTFHQIALKRHIDGEFPFAKQCSMDCHWPWEELTH